MSSDIELAGFDISYTALGGIYAKTDPDCSFEATRENFTFKNLSIHDCYLHHIQDEGFLYWEFKIYRTIFTQLRYDCIATFNGKCAYLQQPD